MQSRLVDHIRSHMESVPAKMRLNFSANKMGWLSSYRFPKVDRLPHSEPTPSPLESLSTGNYDWNGNYSHDNFTSLFTPWHVHTQKYGLYLIIDCTYPSATNCARRKWIIYSEPWIYGTSRRTKRNHCRSNKVVLYFAAEAAQKSERRVSKTGLLRYAWASNFR